MSRIIILMICLSQFMSLLPRQSTCPEPVLKCTAHGRHLVSSDHLYEGLGLDHISVPFSALFPFSQSCLPIPAAQSWVQ